MPIIFAQSVDLIFCGSIDIYINSISKCFLTHNVTLKGNWKDLTLSNFKSQTLKVHFLIHFRIWFYMKSKCHSSGYLGGSLEIIDLKQKIVSNRFIIEYPTMKTLFFIK